MLRFLDVLLTLVHLFIIGFNLLGWIWWRTRRLHLVFVGVTAFCWLVLGAWYGLGYCPVTDWQWRVKARLGERHLPGSFITYYAQKLSGRTFNPAMVDTVVAVTFFLAIALSVYVNFFLKRSGGNKARARSM
jgi:hypothetical protein